MNERFISERNDTFCKLEGTTMMNLGTQQEVKNGNFWELEQNKNKFLLEMGKSSSNVPNVYKGSSLTGQRVRGY